MTAPALPSPSVVRRVIAWLLLVVVGNVAVGALVFVAAVSPLELPPSKSFAWLRPYVSPMYAPASLFFTSALSMLVSLRRGDGADKLIADEIDNGNRLIARAVQFAMTIVLSFAVVMVVTRPTDVAVALFGLLLGFVTYVLADRFAPPAVVSAKAQYRNAVADRVRRAQWAESALGTDWRRDLISRVLPAAVIFFAAPVVAMIVGGVIISSMIWGMAWGLSWSTIAVFFLISYGPIILTAGWFSAADKADSPTARGWRTAIFFVFAVGFSVAVSSVFFFSGSDAKGLSVFILTITAVQALVLWLPLPSAAHKTLRRIAATLTDRHLRRIEENEKAARTACIYERRSTTGWNGFRARLGRRISGDANNDVDDVIRSDITA